MHPSAYADARDFMNRFLDVEALLHIGDVGSYDVNGCLKPLFVSPNWQYTGLDIQAGPNVDVVLSQEYEWSGLLENQFEVTVSTQVLEHVRMPWRWIKDVVNITKVGGLIYICTPHTIMFHEYPIDCWRCWPDGMRALMEYAGLQVIECRKNEMDTTGIARRTK